MPTARMTQELQDNIMRDVTSYLWRAMNSIKFPLDAEALPEIGIALLPEEIQDAYRLLYSRRKDLLKTSGPWSSTLLVRIPDSEDCYKVEIRGVELPEQNLIIDERHQHWGALIDYCRKARQIEEQIRAARAWLYKVVSNASSAGQLYRVFEKPVIDKMPQRVIDSLGFAERLSRWPYQVSQEDAKENNQKLTIALALASIAPDEPQGLYADIGRTSNY